MSLLTSFLVRLMCIAPLLGTAPGFAQIARPLDLAELSQRAGQVVVGRCVEVQTESLAGYANIPVTKITLAVSQVLKGTPTQTLVFRQYGASNDPGLPHLKGFQKGEEVLLLLRTPSKVGLTSPVGIEQGRFAIRDDAQGVKVAQNGRSNWDLFPLERVTGILSTGELQEVQRANQGEPLRLTLLTKILQWLITQN
ncbi:hypothetical protein [Candidatus Cyanaurora vandensis]|uniref:hypothetical protein n=1 Tax=Candidatus Cyanaurora vandensis TaxID=2714958 RepID=UPI00257F4203|nr:hypothetical protein [Candidatus Cyanaurora vandensis]